MTGPCEENSSQICWYGSAKQAEVSIHACFIIQVPTDVPLLNVLSSPSAPLLLYMQAAAWIIHIFFIVFFAVNIARLVIFIRRRREEKRRRQLVEYDTADDTPPVV